MALAGWLVFGFIVMLVIVCMLPETILLPFYAIQFAWELLEAICTSIIVMCFRLAFLVKWLVEGIVQRRWNGQVVGTVGGIVALLFGTLLLWLFN